MIFADIILFLLILFFFLQSLHRTSLYPSNLSLSLIYPSRRWHQETTTNNRVRIMCFFPVSDRKYLIINAFYLELFMLPTLRQLRRKWYGLTQLFDSSLLTWQPRSLLGLREFMNRDYDSNKKHEERTNRQKPKNQNN